MSLITFNLTEDHLKLIPFLTFKIDGRSVVAGSETESPFGGEDFYEDMGLMLYGKIEEVDPFAEDGPSFTTEQKKYMERLFQDLPRVLELVLGSGVKTPGEYYRKHHHDVTDWKPVGSKKIRKNKSTL